MFLSIVDLCNSASNENFHNFLFSKNIAITKVLKVQKNIIFTSVQITTVKKTILGEVIFRVLVSCNLQVMIKSVCALSF
jgi:hypothetical protein